MVMLDTLMNNHSDVSEDSMAIANAYREANVSVCKRNEHDLSVIK